LGRWRKKWRDDLAFRDALEPDTPSGGGWKTVLMLVVVLALFGLVANRLVWATIEGFGR
jgi:hypothetical protein